VTAGLESTKPEEDACLDETTTDRLLRWAAIASFFAIAISLCVFDVRNVDFGWHLKTGEVIWNTGSIPTHDIFSYIAEGRPWVDSHWLFQLLLYGAYDTAGPTGAIFLRGVLVVATFALLLGTNFRKAYSSVWLIVALFALFCTHQRFLLRPELISLFFLAAFFFTAERLSTRPVASLSTAFVCQLLWTNMHGLHVLGIAFAGLIFAGDGLQWLANRHLPRLSKFEVTSRDLKLKAGLLAMVLVASTLNANGLDGMLYPYRIFTELTSKVSYFPILSELAPTFSGAGANFGLLHPINIYKVLLGVSLLSWLGQWRQVRFAYLLLYLAFLYLSILAMRNVALFAIVATPITVWNVSVIVDSARGSRLRRLVTSRKVASVTAGAMSIFAVVIWTANVNDQLYARLGSSKSFGMGVSETFPSGMIPRLRKIKGHIFNTPNLGGYLIWQLFPEKQIAVDGRWEVYGETLPEILYAYQHPVLFSRLVKRYDIQAILLDRWSGHAKRMAAWLQTKPGWRITHSGRHAVLYQRARSKL